MARLYCNENFPLNVVLKLREMGHDVLTSHEAKQVNQSIPDVDVLEFASKQGRALLTINRKDFKALHKKVREHTGIIVCTQDIDFEGQANRIDQALAGQSNLANQLIRVIRPNRRD